MFLLVRFSLFVLSGSRVDLQTFTQRRPWPSDKRSRVRGVVHRRTLPCRVRWRDSVGSYCYSFLCWALRPLLFCYREHDRWRGRGHRAKERLLSETFVGAMSRTKVLEGVKTNALKGKARSSGMIDLLFALSWVSLRLNNAVLFVWGRERCYSHPRHVR